MPARIIECSTDNDRAHAYEEVISSDATRVLVYGPDGSGKTFYAEQYRSLLERAGFYILEQHMERTGDMVKFIRIGDSSLSEFGFEYDIVIHYNSIWDPDSSSYVLRRL
jgi:hypothetical protein